MYIYVYIYIYIHTYIYTYTYIVILRTPGSGLRLVACNSPASAKWVLTTMSEIREKILYIHTVHTYSTYIQYIHTYIYIYTYIHIYIHIDYNTKDLGGADRVMFMGISKETSLRECRVTRIKS